MSSAPTMNHKNAWDITKGTSGSRGRTFARVRRRSEGCENDVRLNESFSRTQETLIAATRQARKEISEGKASPLDVENL